jgi:patatin-like phospholipase/acyl hydrolase
VRSLSVTRNALLTLYSVVLAVTKEDVGAPTTKFKTYNIGDDFRDYKVWEIARATSAVTTFFPSFSCGLQEIEFIDAGFRHNNPTKVLLSEAASLFPLKDVEYILSIGTSLDGVVPIKNSRRSIIDALLKIASNS